MSRTLSKKNAGFTVLRKQEVHAWTCLNIKYVKAKSLLGPLRSNIVCAIINQR
jgi:hypothetical protein